MGGVEDIVGRESPSAAADGAKEHEAGEHGEEGEEEYGEEYGEEGEEDDEEDDEEDNEEDGDPSDTYDESSACDEDEAAYENQPAAGLSPRLVLKRAVETLQVSIASASSLCSFCMAAHS